MGARGSGGFLGLRIGSVSERCLHHAKCPIAIIRDVERDPVPTEECIVVGVDGSEHARPALAWALDEARLATLLGVRRHCVEHRCRWPRSPADRSSTSPLSRTALARILRCARGRRDTTGSRSPIEPVLVAGGAAGAILAEAKDATLVVVGARGLGGLKSLLLGSVSHQVAHHVPCPVVVIPGEQGD